MLDLVTRHLIFPFLELKNGAKRLKYLRELSETQWWDLQRLRQQQWKRLCEIVLYASKNCPHYGKRFDASGLGDGLRDWTAFRRLPLLSKQEVRVNLEDLLSREFRRDDLVQAKTGGSTGAALDLYFDRSCQELRNAAAMRSDRWAGWDIGMKVAAVWGNPPVADTTRKKLRNVLVDRFMFLDTMDMSEESVRRFVANWRRQRPKVLFGHSHSLYVLAMFLRALGETLRPRGIISTSMTLLEPERRVIETVFECKVTNRYGCEEVSLIGCECEQHDGLHLNVDHVVVEFLRPDGTEAAPGEEAEVVVTDLINRGMPMIRYRVGDMGVPSDRACKCGRGLPLMERVTGRQADFLKRSDGSMVAGVSLVERTLTAIAGIEQMQIVQDEIGRLTINLVKDERFDASSEQALRAELLTVFGDGLSVEIRNVSALDQTRSGKYRFAICNV